MKFFYCSAVFICLAFLVLSRPAGACIICHDITTSGEKKVQDLVREKGREAIPELREILACDDSAHLRAKIVAARELGRLRDRESIPELKRIVLELLRSGSSSRFGAIAPEHSLREVAATSLHQMGVEGIGEEIWRNWRELPPERREELPRIFYCLGVPGLEDKLLRMLQTSGNEFVEFQVVLELRRSGTSRAIPELKKILAKWEKASSESKVIRRRRFLAPLIKYTKSTIQVLKRK